MGDLPQQFSDDVAKLDKLRLSLQSGSGVIKTLRVPLTRRAMRSLAML